MLLLDFLTQKQLLLWVIQELAFRVSDMRENVKLEHTQARIHTLVARKLISLTV